MKKATAEIRIRRKMITDAAIFRFLSLQRKAILTWQCVTEARKKNKIKNHFGVTLYYTRTMDKAFSALRLNW